MFEVIYYLSIENQMYHEIKLKLSNFQRRENPPRITLHQGVFSFHWMRAEKLADWELILRINIKKPRLNWIFNISLVILFLASNRDLTEDLLILSWRRSLSYRNQFIDMLSKSMEWFLYDRDLRHEKVSCSRQLSLSS